MPNTVSDRRAGPVAGQQLGHAEVGDLWVAGGVEQNVGRLQVAVEHAALMRMVDGAGNRRDQPADVCLLRRNRRSGEGGGAASGAGSA